MKKRLQRLSSLAAATLLFVSPACALDDSASKNEIAAAEKDYYARNFDAVIDRCKLLVARDQNNLDAHYLMANALLRLNRAPQATEEYQFCISHDPSSQAGRLAAIALRGISANTNNTAANATPLVADPNAEIKASLHAKAATEIDAKRKTMMVSVRRIRDRAQKKIASIPSEYQNEDGVAMPNPDYPGQVAAIREKADTKIRALEADFENESGKVNDFYDKLARSYDTTSNNLKNRQTK